MGIEGGKLSVKGRWPKSEGGKLRRRAKLRAAKAYKSAVERQGGFSRSQGAASECVTITPSSGCVFCDMKLEPTNCTDGWHHLLKGGGAVRCAIKN
jgi:hypothetical protein